jgi:Abortive infection C-terminus
MKSLIQKYIDELQSIDLNMNWYFEDNNYQDIIDSQLNSIIERIGRCLKKESKNSVFKQIQSSLANISNISAQIHFLIEFLSEFLSEELNSHGNKSIGHLERFELINKIACKLQELMVTTEINLFLSGFGVTTEDVNIVQSKKIYVQDLLKNVDPLLITSIASELNIISHNLGIISIESMQQLIKSKNLDSVLEDFNRALKNIDNDPEQAIASSSSTLESICKAIIELEKKTLPKKKAIGTLLSDVIEIVNFNPNSHSDVEIKRILSGIRNVILGIGAMRTGFSSAHGHGIKKYKLSKRHVRLLVNSMITFGTFILESYIEKRK